MNNRSLIGLSALLAVMVLLVPALEAEPSQGATGPASVPLPSTKVPIMAEVAPVSSIWEPPPIGQKAGIPKLEDRLAQLYGAHKTGDADALASFAGERHVDLAGAAVRVILEMDESPEAHPVGEPRVESVALPDGHMTQIYHAPAIAIRQELAEAIAAAGATYETAYENWVQVLAPLASLEG